MAILALNCGSSSVKYAVFDADLRKVAGATIESAGDDAIAEALVAAQPHGIAAVGHRIVHGGPHHAAPVIIDDQIRNDIAALADWAPQHQPGQLRAIDLARAAFARVPHVACFDTAFHRTIPRERQEMALPPGYAARGLLRYGFHGLSCQHVAETVAANKIIACHLGNGCSVTAIEHGRSVHTSMGFTPVDGLMMGTRSGSLDPGAVLWLVDDMGSAAAVRALINQQAGLAGVSGLSSDMRVLLAATDERVRFAIRMFVDRLVLEIGRAAAALQGMDVLVFTGGIGENAAAIRDAVAQNLAWLGVGARGNRKVVIVRADEERVIAKASLAVVGHASRPGSSAG